MTKREIANEIRGCINGLQDLGIRDTEVSLRKLKNRLLGEADAEEKALVEPVAPRLPVGFPFVPMTSDDRLVLE